MSEYQLIHAWNLPNGDFSVTINDEYRNMINRKAKAKFKTLKNLVKFLYKNCNSLNQFAFSTSFQRMWKCMKGKYQLPLDCFIQLVKILGEDLETSEKQIEMLGCKYVKNPLKISFPIKVDENLAIISEAIRTEGSLSKDLRKIEISNSNMNILSQFKNALFEEFKLAENDIITSLNSQIAIPNDVSKGEINIEDLSNNKKINNFAIIDKKLKRGLKRQIYITDYDISWPGKKEYLITFRDKQIKCKIQIPEKGYMKYESDSEEYRNNISSILKLRIGNVIIGKLLHHSLKIPCGRKSERIFLPEIIRSSPKSVIKKAFEITFACEGSASENIVRIRSISTKFLLDWKSILFNKFNIESNITNNSTQLQITRKENFKKLLNEFNFIQDYKYEQLMKNSQVIDMLPPYTADDFYLGVIKMLGGKATNREIADTTNKSFFAIKKHLPRLVEKELIEKQVIWKRGFCNKCVYVLKK